MTGESRYHIQGDSVSHGNLSTTSFWVYCKVKSDLVRSTMLELIQHIHTFIHAVTIYLTSNQIIHIFIHIFIHNIVIESLSLEYYTNRKRKTLQ